jgi:DivIVA domain-containing protein
MGLRGGIPRRVTGSHAGVADSPGWARRATIVRMGQLLLYIAAALVIAAIVFGVTVILGGGDSGLTPAEPDGRALPLPSDRPLDEEDLIRTRFDVALRGYRMAQVDQALQRAAYDIGYKGELIGVLEAEVLALREGRIGDADVLRRAREAAVAPPPDVADEPVAGVPAPQPPTASAPEPPPAPPSALASESPPGADPSASVALEEEPAAKDGEPVERR